MEKLIQFFQQKKIQNVLDVGTGSGDFIAVLKEAFPKAKITGIDPSQESLQIAKEKYQEVNFAEMAAENLHFTENTFDAVSISMALHHLPNVKKSFEEMQRVLKQGGWIIVSELYSDNLTKAQEVHKLFHHFRSTTDRLLGISHNPTFKRNEILALIEKSGFQIEFSFDFSPNENVISNPEEIEERIEKMKMMLECVKDFPEYVSLTPKIEEFRKKALKYGFQPAPRVVIAGKLNP